MTEQRRQKKKRMEPTFRCGTRKAIDELSEELNIPYDSSMQDWSYTEGNPDDIEKYISHYWLTKDEDKRFILMEFIIQSTEDQNTKELFLKYCDKIKPILESDFKLQEYTIYYWACFDNKNIEDCWRITPFMRQIWAENRKLKILFVCTVNRMRSATAHKIYESDERFKVKSAGTDKTANTVLTKEILCWADSIIVMEKHHRNHIRKHFPEIYKKKKIVCLYIPDDYDFMQTELIGILKHKVEDVYSRKLL
jgi:predicted protein tyrosine phosphatase